MLGLEKCKSNLGRENIKMTKTLRISLVLFVTTLQTTMVATVCAASSSDRIFLLDGSVLNGEPVNSLDNEITVVPREAITGVLKIRVENDHSSGAVVPVIYTPSWGEHSSSWVSVKGWAPTGTSFYNVPISLTAPAEGTYYIIFGSQGQTHGSYIASLTGWFLGFNSWNDGIDLADMDEVDLGDCMTTGFATLPVLETGGVYGDCGTGCTYIKVNALTEPIRLPDIDVWPTSCDFGDVDVDSSETLHISVSNTGDGNLTVSSIGFQSGSSPDFSATTPSLPMTISPGGNMDIEVTFSPSEALPSLAVLEINSNDPDESLAYVSLVGTGMEKTLSDQIQEILETVYDAVTDGALLGVGSPKVAERKLQDWIAKLQYARDVAEDGLMAEAYVWLEDAYKLADGDIRPPDSVRGNAVPQLAEELKALLDELTPELEFEFETSNGNALVYSIPISVLDKRMGRAIAEGALGVTENALKFLISGKIPNPLPFIADVLVQVSELYDPVTVVPVGPNMELTRANKILATVSPATGNNDYSAIVVLDLLGTGWTETDAGRVGSGLTLRAENRYGTEYYGSINLLSKEEIKRLNPYRCYIVAPKSYFQAMWSKRTYVFLNAFYEYGLGEDSDIEPILIQPE